MIVDAPWLQRMTLSTRPLVEKMTLFWHGHFATSQREVKNSHHMWLQNTTLRTHALGNFKDLVRAIARDPAMLAYLNNNQNNRSRPNENFARELLELFTLGIGNYTEQDVKEAARALTGWTFRGNEFVFARRAHDDGEKTFLGKTGKLTGDEVIDIIFEQPAASRFVVRKLFVYFAHEEPSAETIETLAKTFRDSRFEVKPVLTQMFGSAEFYSPSAMGNRVKSPVELVVGTLRLLKIDPGATPALAQVAGRMGQEIFAPPSVKGWDGGQAWISTSTVFDRYNFTRPLLALDEAPRNRPAGAGKRKGAAAGKKRPDDRARPRLPHWDARGFEVEVLGKESSSLSTAEAVDRVLKRFLMVDVSAESRKKLEELYSRAKPEVRLAELIHVLLSSPEYQVG